MAYLLFLYDYSKQHISYLLCFFKRRFLGILAATSAFRAREFVLSRLPVLRRLKTEVD